MRYHFKIHKEQGSYWAECLELEGCLSQGDTLDELKKNLKEALDLYLDEPEDSKLVIPLPKKKGVLKRNVITIEADPHIALAVMIRNERLKKHLSQKATADRLGIPLYSYQKLESARTSNPQWKTLIKLKKLFPKLDLNGASLSA
jgi:antitoxin HicB